MQREPWRVDYQGTMCGPISCFRIYALGVDGAARDMETRTVALVLTLQEAEEIMRAHNTAEVPV